MLLNGIASINWNLASLTIMNEFPSRLFVAWTGSKVFNGVKLSLFKWDDSHYADAVSRIELVALFSNSDNRLISGALVVQLITIIRKGAFRTIKLRFRFFYSNAAAAASAATADVAAVAVVRLLCKLRSHAKLKLNSNTHITSLFRAIKKISR